jgi:solute carrier family 35 protein F1/2
MDAALLPAPARPSYGHLFRLIGVGQAIALFITLTGVFSQLLATRGVSLPTSQSMLNYAALSLFTIPLVTRYRRKKVEYERIISQQSFNQLIHQNSESQIETPLINLSANQSLIDQSSNPTALTAPKLLSTRWYIYLILALLDVQGNALLVAAYDYTNITSVQLLDCFTVPIVMILSYFMLRVRFNKQHVLGTVMCLAGVTTLVLSDLYIQSLSTDSRNALLGDAFVLVGCLCYAISNLSQEHIVKNADAVEWLSMIGLFGTLVSGIQVLILEREGLAAVVWDGEIIAYVAGFVVCMVSVYLTVPLLLQQSSAVFLNLSLLTSDFWSVLAGYAIFHLQLHFVYFIAFALIVIGLVLYNLAATSMAMKWLTSSNETSHEDADNDTVRSVEMQTETSIAPTAH